MQESTGQFKVNTKRYDPYKTFKFRIMWDGKYVAGVSKVSGLARKTELVEHREGGAPSKPRSRTFGKDIIIELYNQAEQKRTPPLYWRKISTHEKTPLMAWCKPESEAFFPRSPVRCCCTLHAV